MPPRRTTGSSSLARGCYSTECRPCWKPLDDRSKLSDSTPLPFSAKGGFFLLVFLGIQPWIDAHRHQANLSPPSRFGTSCECRAWTRRGALSIREGTAYPGGVPIRTNGVPLKAQYFARFREGSSASNPEMHARRIGARSHRPSRRACMPRLSQETPAISGASVGPTALILTSTPGIRGEVQAPRSRCGPRCGMFAPKPARTGRHSRATSSG